MTLNGIKKGVILSESQSCLVLIQWASSWTKKVCQWLSEGVLLIFWKSLKKGNYWMPKVVDCTLSTLPEALGSSIYNFIINEINYEYVWTSPVQTHTDIRSEVIPSLKTIVDSEGVGWHLMLKGEEEGVHVSIVSRSLSSPENGLRIQSLQHWWMVTLVL